MSLIAIPLINGALSEHFGRSQALALVEVNDTTREVVNIEILPLKQHACEQIPALILARKAQTVILVGIGGRPLMALQEAGVGVYAGTPGAAPYDLAKSWAEGKLRAHFEPCQHHEDHDHVCHGDHGEEHA